MTQVFIVLGKIGTNDHHAEETVYVYAFTDPDEAMEFVELAQAHEATCRRAHAPIKLVPDDNGHDNETRNS